MKKLLLSVIPALTLLSTQGIAQADSSAFEAQASNVSFVQTPITSALSLSDFTLESWIFIPSAAAPNTEKHVIETYASSGVGGYVLRVSNSGSIKAWVMGGNGQFQLTGSSPVPVDSWVHISCTYSSTEDSLKVFLYGIQDGQQNIATTAATTFPTNLKIGARGDDSNINDDIVIDEVRIWDYAKTAAEISTGMDACYDGSESGLVLYYDFENVSGTNVNDLTSNGHDGTIQSPNNNIVDGVYSCQSSAGVEGFTENDVVIYPNPVNDQLFIDCEYDVTNITVVDVTGAIVMQSNAGDKNVSVAQLPNGFYFLKISTPNGLVQKSFVKA